MTSIFGRREYLVEFPCEPDPGERLLPIVAMSIVVRLVVEEQLCGLSELNGVRVGLSLDFINETWHPGVAGTNQHGWVANESSEECMRLRCWTEGFQPGQEPLVRGTPTEADFVLF